MTEAPKPRPPVKKLEVIQPSAKESTPSTKVPYVRKPHLTDRPLRDNEKLQKLQAELKKKPLNLKGARFRTVEEQKVEAEKFKKTSAGRTKNSNH